MGNCCFASIIKNNKLKFASLNNTSLFSLDGLKTYGKIIDIYDGDTCTIAIYLDCIGIKSFKCRLSGIDTPEMIEQTKTIAIKARNKLLFLASDGLINIDDSQIYTRDMIRKKCEEQHHLIYIECGKFDKYGRLLVTLYLDKNKNNKNNNINQELIKLGLAKEYNGGKKE
jgi:endonuclease YncB( thermonuclease family)